MRSEDLVELLEERARDHGVVGTQVALLVDGEVTSASVGMSDAGSGVPMTDQATMPIASVTKPMVATVIARLVARGGFALDDPVASCVPELASSDWARRATVRQLLANTSGVPLRRGREFAFPATGRDAFALYAADIAPDRPLTPPGEVWGYQNTGWNLLGRVIEAATGLLWEEAMRTELFVPLGMGSSRFFHEGDVERPSCCYEVDGGQHREAEAWANRANGPGGAGLWSSALDLIRFVRPHVEGGEYELLRTPHASPPLPNFLDEWCLGMARFGYDGGPVWGWDGIGPGHRAILRFLPQRGAIAFLANTSTGRPLYRSVFPALLQECFGVVMPPPFDEGRTDTSPLDRFAGTYGWLDTSMTVVAEGATLTVSDSGTPATVHRIGESTFVLDPENPADSSLTFANVDDDGKPQLLYDLVWPFPRTA